MVRGLYISASSAVTEGKRVDTIANNIANVNTTGFKKDTLVSESFPDVLIAKMGGEFPDKDILRLRNSSNEINTVSEGEAYTVKTNSGFFNVETNLGISRNRSIKFEVNEENYLVTPQGDYILGVNGRINTGGAPVSFDNRGQILAGGTVIDRFKITNPLNVIGNISAGVHVDEIRTDFTQGHLDPTGNSTDLAIKGNGFFAIDVNGEERYSRDGSFTLNSEGYLVNKDGHKVLGEKGFIKIEGKNISINEIGEILLDGSIVDKLKLVDFEDYKALRKEGDSLYTALNDDWPDNAKEFSGVVNQGFLEGSNVNSIKEMVDMISMLRSYEANQRLIKAHDELLGRAVNDVGKL